MSSLRFLQIHLFYAPYIEDFYKTRPELRTKSYRSQIQTILADGFSGGHLFSASLEAHGWETQLVIANCGPTQKTWAKENGLEDEKDPTRILLQQIERFRPDILYITDPNAIDSSLVRKLSYTPRLVVGWRAASVGKDRDWSAFDCIYSHLEVSRRLALQLGARDTEFFHPGVPIESMDAVQDQEPEYDVVFCGQWSSEHTRRNCFLEAVAKNALQNGGEWSVAFFLMVHPRSTVPDVIKAVQKPAQWGREMYRALRRGRIAINAEINLARGNAGNMRLFEATGVGTFLLTEHQPDIANFFEPGTELDTFSDAAELVAKIEHYLKNPSLRNSTAASGRLRCVREYSLEARTSVFRDMLFRRWQQATRGVEGEGIPKSVSDRQTAKHLSTAYAASPELVSKLHAIAFALDSGELNQAGGWIRQLKKAKVHHPELEHLRVRFFIRLAKLRDALEAAKEAARAFPDDPKIVDYLGFTESICPAEPCPSVRPADNDFCEFYERVRSTTMLSGQRLYNLYRLAKKACLEDLPGNFAECGVAGGGGTLLLALTVRKYSLRPRRIFAFDTFEGMPDPQSEDVDDKGRFAADSDWAGGTCAGSLDFVRSSMREHGVGDIVECVPGLFEKTLAAKKSTLGGLALLHADGDWYSSIKTTFEELYDSIVPGGLIQVDDYGFWQGCAKAVDEFARKRGIDFRLQSIDKEGVWMEKPTVTPFSPNPRPEIAPALERILKQTSPDQSGVESRLSPNERSQIGHAVCHFLPRRNTIVLLEVGSFQGSTLALTSLALKDAQLPHLSIGIEEERNPALVQVAKQLGEDSTKILFGQPHEILAGLESQLKKDSLRPAWAFVDPTPGEPKLDRILGLLMDALCLGGVLAVHDAANLDGDDKALEAWYGREGNRVPSEVERLLQLGSSFEELSVPVRDPSDTTAFDPLLPRLNGCTSTLRFFRKTNEVSQNHS